MTSYWGAASKQSVGCQTSGLPSTFTSLRPVDGRRRTQPNTSPEVGAPACGHEHMFDFANLVDRRTAHLPHALDDRVHPWMYASPSCSPSVLIGRHPRTPIAPSAMKSFASPLPQNPRSSNWINVNRVKWSQRIGGLDEYLPVRARTATTVAFPPGQSRAGRPVRDGGSSPLCTGLGSIPGPPFQSPPVGA